MAKRVGFEPNSSARSAVLDALETTRYASKRARASEDGGESGIRTLEPPLDSATYRISTPRVAVNAGDDMAPGTLAERFADFRWSSEPRTETGHSHERFMPQAVRHGLSRMSPVTSRAICHRTSVCMNDDEGEVRDHAASAWGIAPNRL